MLITPEYLELQRKLHADPRGYGTKGSKWADHVQALLRKVSATSMLDYGCGQGSLRRTLVERGHINIREYDPAIAGKDAPPSAADLVVCTDVLEHVEPELIDQVLGDLRRVTRKAAFIVVSLVEAGKTLADGRNAHILIRPADWWRAKLGEHFDLVEAGPFREVKGHKEFAALWRPND